MHGTLLSKLCLLGLGVAALVFWPAGVTPAGEYGQSKSSRGGAILVAMDDCPCRADRGVRPLLGSPHGGWSQGNWAPQAWSPQTWGPGSRLPAPGHGPLGPVQTPIAGPLALDGPPPGTLGRTYRVPTALVPVDKHPRVGMLDVYVARDLLSGEGFDDRHYVKAAIEGIEGFIGEDNHWHFESEPLIPGVSHVYQVRFDVVRVDKKTEIQYGRTIEKEVETTVKHLGYRTVRLIPGRIVELRY